MERYKRNPNTKCSICKKEIYRRPSVLSLNNGRAYCDQVCYGKSCRKEISCLVCKSPILAGANKKTCSRECSNINRKGTLYTRSQTKDKVKQNRTLKKILLKERGRKCERCSYKKYEILHVHHIDRDRKNNSLKNLELICPNCHAVEHLEKR